MVTKKKKKSSGLSEVGAFLVEVCNVADMSELEFRKAMRWKYNVLWHYKRKGKALSYELLRDIACVTGLKLDEVLSRYALHVVSV